MYKLYFDSGSRLNPGPCAIAYIILDNENKVIHHASYYVSDKLENNRGEYLACIYGLLTANVLKITDIEVYGDSKLVINQVNGIYQVKNDDLKHLYQQVKSLEYKFAHITFNHINRNAKYQNDCDRLCNLILYGKATKK